jgi:hypothetical protein
VKQWDRWSATLKYRGLGGRRPHGWEELIYWVRRVERYYTKKNLRTINPYDNRYGGVYCKPRAKKQRDVKDIAKSKTVIDVPLQKGSPTNRPNPPAHAYPTKVFSIFQSLWKILKQIPDYKNYSKHCEYRINFSNLWL